MHYLDEHYAAPEKVLIPKDAELLYDKEAVMLHHQLVQYIELSQYYSLSETEEESDVKI